MVVIKQHGDAQELFDLCRFLADIDRFFLPDEWHIQIEACMGIDALHIEEISVGRLSLSDARFRELYRGIYQTIDGQFVGLAAGQELFELCAVDSSYWEISESAPFEAHMLATYGAWTPSWKQS
jgi:hypothetical protein